VYILLVNFAAVYLDHHYIIDIVLGNLLAIAVAYAALHIVKTYSHQESNPRLRILFGRLTGSALFTALILVAVVLHRYGFLSADGIIDFFHTHPVSAPALFIVLFAVMACMFISTFIITIAAGFLWGPVWGLLIVMTGSTLGSTLSFLISRYLAGDYFLRRLQNPRWRQLQLLIHRRGWLSVACARILPVFPFALINYFFGITPIRFSEYLWSSFVFILPSTFILVLCGSMVKSIALPTTGKIRLLLCAAGVIVLGILLLFRHIFRKYLPASDTR
jgi:uncharacterized membrane protein YdjX (TVP38/TMEM64 family)